MTHSHDLRLFSVLGLACLCVSIARAEEWPRWRGPRGDGTWHAPPLPKQWPEPGLKVLWKRPVGGGYSGLAVANGIVYTLDRRKEPLEVERLLALDAATGEPHWSAEYPVRYEKLDYGNGPRSTPTIHAGRVYTLGGRGRRHNSRVGPGRIAPHLARPGDRASGGQPNACLLALDRTTGKEVWRQGGDPAGYATPILIQHAGREQLVAWTPLHIVGLDPGTGKQHWSIPYKVTYGVSIATPIFHEGLLFVSGYCEGSKAIQLGDLPEAAELAWEDNRHLRGIMSQPIYRQGHVYSLDKQYGLTCFELATGKKLWDDGNRMAPRGRNPQANLVWLGSSDRATWAHPAFAGDRVFARTDEEIVTLQLPTAAPD